MSTDRMEKSAVLRAPQKRVWKAISDSGEFGTWFGMVVDGVLLEIVESGFDALGDPNRLRIMIWLCHGGPCSTSVVSQASPASRQAAAKHLLLLLESAGLVHSSKRGRERIWTVETQSLASAGDYLKALSQRWDRRIERLRALVEDPADPSSR